jgi:hypothetical protein
MAAKFIFEVKAYDGIEAISLSSVVSLKKWLEKEIEYWTTLNQGLSEDPTNSRIPNMMLSRYQQLMNHAKTATDSPSANADANLQNQLKAQLFNSPIPFTSASPAANFLNDVLTNFGSRIATHCLIIIQNHPHLDNATFTAIERVQSKQLVSDFLSGNWKTKSATTAAATQTSLKALHKRYSDKLSDVEGRENTIFHEIQTNRDQQDSQLKKFKKVLRRRVARNIVSSHKSSGAAIEEINTTKAAFIEFMHLEAPVTYWSKKAEKHKKKEDTYRNILVIYAALCFIFYGTLFTLTFKNIESISTSTSIHASVLLAGLGLTVTTILLWTARILTRMFLSEKHLRTDAEERSVMLETYVALIKEGQATDAERAIVLAPVFRPTEDGLVKDDAAPLVDLSKLVKPR